MPRVSGVKLARSPLWGLSQTIRWHNRDSRSMADSRSSGSPRSSPSEQITTMPPRVRPRRAHRRTNSSRQNADPGPALPVGHRGGRAVEGEVGAAVLELAGDPGQPGPEAEDLDPARTPWSRCARTARGCASSRPSSPDTSSSSVSRRVRSRRRRRWREPGSPCSRIDSRTVRRRSGSRPWRVGTVRRVRASGRRELHGPHQLPQQRGSSSGVQAAKLLVLTVEALAAAYPSSACCCSLLLAETLGLGDRPGSPAPRRGRPRENGGAPGEESGVTEVVGDEGPVVRRHLLAPGEQRAAPGPVEVDQVGHVDDGRSRRSRSARRPSRPDAGPAERGGEADQHRREVRTPSIGVKSLPVAPTRRRSPGSGTGGDPAEVLADLLEVVAVLDHRTEGVVGDVRARAPRRPPPRGSVPSRWSRRRRAAWPGPSRAAGARRRPRTRPAGRETPGARTCTISSSRSAVGNPTQW